MKHLLCLSIATVSILFFGENALFAQCGADGKQPCKKTPKKTTIPKKMTKTVKSPREMTFVTIPAGEFQMGSNDGDDYANPVHTVKISKSFQMQTTEVTQAQWQAVMNNNPSVNKNCPNCPVENVSWNDVQDFIGRLNKRNGGKYRLPTEAEWEYACRAGSTTKYSYGDDESSLENYAWYDENKTNTTHQVAMKEPNAWGLYDMHGNVWEWVQDWYGAYQSSEQVDPTGPSSGSFRVMRGGGWFNYGKYLRSTYRRNFTPSFRYDDLGFRLIRE